MTASNWEIGRRIVQFEQQGQERAEYGEALVSQLAGDLSQQFGRGFSQPNLLEDARILFGMARETDSLDSVERIFKIIFLQGLSFAPFRYPDGLSGLSACPGRLTFAYCP